MTMRKQHEFSAEEVAAAQAEFPGLSEAEARISLERRQVYGDPYQNHYGIAQSWAGLLQVWAPRIARGEPTTRGARRRQRPDRTAEEARS